MRRVSLLAASLTVLTMLAFAAGAQAQPLRIDGISPLEPLSVADVTPVVAGHTLDIRLPDDRRLRVAPWPMSLPQHFGAQKIEASRHLHPAGPTDRVAFIRSPARQPWLVVGNGARDGTVLIGAWQLRHAGDGWTVSDGHRSERWRLHAPLSVSVGRERWCLSLLDAGRPHDQSGMAREGEAQIAWAALRCK